MSWIRPILATIAASVVPLFVEITWHDTLFSMYYESIPYIVREEPRFMAPTIAALLRGGIMSTLYSVVVGRRGSLSRSGLLFGGIIGLLTAVYWTPTYYAQQPIPEALPWFLMEGSFFLIQGMVAGLLIALIYGKSTRIERTAAQVDA